jgi:hypothetical protein
MSPSAIIQHINLHEALRIFVRRNRSHAFFFYPEEFPATTVSFSAATTK